MDLKGKVIVVTGGGQGLGRTFAVDLAKKGSNIAIVDMNEEKMAETKALCEAEGVKAVSYSVNVSKEDQVVELFNKVVADFGTVDGLINNAGITRDGLLVRKKDGEVKKMSLENWQAVIDVNLTGVFLCGREFFVKLLEQDKSGVCINISSISRNGNMGQSNYTATKAGVAEMAVTWAKELAPNQIRVAAIAPGYINTEMVAAIREDVKQKIINTVPLRRLGAPSEISATAVFIFENDYITGRTFEIDGGLRI
jgi:3-oxoacyl-[acyl-carrier protein] reductase